MMAVNTTIEKILMSHLALVSFFVREGSSI
jgi:hypothetical protein